MCHKYLWDSLIAEKFPAENFFSYFDLDPNYLLSDDVKQYISSLGFNAKVLCLTFELCLCFSNSSRAIYCWWPTSLFMEIIQFHMLGNCSVAEIQEVYARLFSDCSLDIHANIYNIFYNPCEFWLLTWFLLADLWRRVEIFRGYLPYSTTVRRIAAIEVN